MEEAAAVKSNVFTDDGRLLQAEYAVKSVAKAGTIAGIACKDGVVLLGVTAQPSTKVEKIYQLSDNIYCVVAGVFGDALSLIRHARQTSTVYEGLVCEEPRLSKVCEAVALYKQESTHYGGTRPFGVSFLYAGYEDDEYALYSTDPLGTLNRWKAWSFGVGDDSINNCLRNNPPSSDLTIEGGVEYLLSTISKAKEISPNLAKEMEVLAYKKNKARIMSADEVRTILERIQSKSSE